MTFGEADKKRNAFGKKANAMEQPLLEVSSFGSEELKRHSYHASSSCEKSSIEDSSVDVEVCWFVCLLFCCFCLFALTNNLRAFWQVHVFSADSLCDWRLAYRVVVKATNMDEVRFKGNIDLSE